MTEATQIKTSSPTIKRVHTATCPSLTQRSTLTYAIGKDKEGAYHLAIVGNDAAGMYCPDYVADTAIDAKVVGLLEITSTTLQPLHPHRSVNTAGFILAVLADLGLVRRSKTNGRHHEHVEGATFASCVVARFDSRSSSDATAQPDTKAKKKPVHTKEGN